MISGVDLHAQYQADFDFDRAYDIGHRFAFIKATEGGAFVPFGTRAFAAAAERAAKSRAIVGYYHFLDNTASGAVQARHFLNTLDRFGDGHKGNMLAVDFEGNGDRTAGDRHLRGFITEMRRHVPKRPIIVYSTHSFWAGQAPGTTPSPPLSSFGDRLVPWDARVAYSTERRNHPRDWHDELLAWYERQPTWGGWSHDRRRRFWQYTWGGLVSGQYVDCDAFYGSYADLQDLAGLGATDAPDKPPDKPDVDDPLKADVEQAIAFALKMIGTPYGTGWRAGTWPPLSPLYARITRHDTPSWYRARPCICSGLINVLRYEVAELPAVGRRQGDGWPGGMAAIGRHLAHAPGSRPYPPVKNTPRGWLVYSPYLGPALALQGHIAIALGNGKIVEARIPALSANRTENDMHRAMIASGGTGNTRIIPPAVWLRS